MQKLSKNDVEDAVKFANEFQAKRKHLRFGQALFYALHRFYPDVSETIRGTDLDPFYDDNKVQECIEFILAPTVTPESSAS